MSDVRNIVNYWELAKEWQVEANINLDELAEVSLYLEPLTYQNPEEHALIDLENAVFMPGVSDGFEYDAVITWSNNSSILIRLNDDSTQATLKMV